MQPSRHVLQATQHISVTGQAPKTPWTRRWSGSTTLCRRGSRRSPNGPAVHGRGEGVLRAVQHGKRMSNIKRMCARCPCRPGTRPPAPQAPSRPQHQKQRHAAARRPTSAPRKRCPCLVLATTCATLATCHGHLMNARSRRQSYLPGAVLSFSNLDIGSPCHSTQHTCMNRPSGDHDIQEAAAAAGLRHLKAAAVPPVLRVQRGRALRPAEVVLEHGDCGADLAPRRHHGDLRARTGFKRCRSTWHGVSTATGHAASSLGCGCGCRALQ